MSPALRVIAALRKLPHSRRVDRHLDACAAHEVLYRQLDPGLPRLRISHVLGMAALPNFRPDLTDAGRERVHAAVFGHDDGWSTMAPPVLDHLDLVQRGAETVH